MNKELELESEKYVNQFGNIPTKELDDAIFKQGFIDGATSKWVEKQKLEFAIDLLYILRCSPHSELDVKIEELEQKLSEL